MPFGTFIVFVSFLACSTAEKFIDACSDGDPDCLASEHVVSLLQSKLSYLSVENGEEMSDANEAAATTPPTTGAATTTAAATTQADDSRPVCTGDACGAIQISRCSNTQTCGWRIERGAFGGNEEARIRLPQAGRLREREVDIAPEHDRLQLNGLTFDEVRLAAHFPAGGVMTVMDNDIIAWMSLGWDQRSDVNSGWMLEYTPQGYHTTTSTAGTTTPWTTTAASTTARGTSIAGTTTPRPWTTSTAGTTTVAATTTAAYGTTQAAGAGGSRPTCSGRSCNSIQITSCGLIESCHWRIARTGGYSNREDARITLPQAGRIRSTDFSTESCCDYLSLDGERYLGSSGPNRQVSGSTTMVWHTDYSVTRDGFTLEYTPTGSAGSQPTEQPAEAHVGALKTAKGCSCMKTWTYMGQTLHGCDNPDMDEDAELWCKVEDRQCEGSWYGRC